MTWLGKILAVRVTLMAAAWMGLAVSIGSAQTTPTEWTNDQALAKRVSDADRVRAQNAKKMADLDAIIKTSDIRAIELAASLQATLEELKGVQQRSNEVGDNMLPRLRIEEYLLTFRRETVKELRDIASRRR
jgi:hypothetical protein